jgi:glycolate oxidase FAD binding subunit
MTAFVPRESDEVRRVVEWAVAERQPLALHGANSLAGWGRPTNTAHSLDLCALTGVVDYEPAELVLTAKPGTTLAEVNDLVARNNQMLAFEPPDFGPLFGGAAGQGTLGGMVGANLFGPRRFKAGALRDHLLGFHAVSGRGEIFKAGAKVVKNVTGYDLPKLVAGAWGTLAVLTELTVKVLPAPEKTRTVLLYGLAPQQAVQVMSDAAGSAHEVSGLAHLPASVAAHSSVDHVRGAAASVTALRVEGAPQSVAWRCDALRKLFAAYKQEELHSAHSLAFWAEVRDVGLLPMTACLWRLSVTPMQAPAVLAALPPGDWLLDQGGGLIWLALDAPQAEAVRAAFATGHATLARAPADMRASTAVWQPQPAALAALSRRVKDAFDPHAILNPGRFP